MESIKGYRVTITLEKTVPAKNKEQAENLAKLHLFNPERRGFKYLDVKVTEE